MDSPIFTDCYGHTHLCRKCHQEYLWIDSIAIEDDAVFIVCPVCGETDKLPLAACDKTKHLAPVVECMFCNGDIKPGTKLYPGDRRYFIDPEATSVAEFNWGRVKQACVACSQKAAEFVREKMKART